MENQHKTGLTDAEVDKSRKQYGSNALTQLPPQSLLSKIINGFKDPMIIILLVALFIQASLFLMGQAEWFEPAGIFIAIIIANGVAAISECSQEAKATALKAEEESNNFAKVIRNSSLQNIHINDIVVGDLIFLQTGDKIPADGPIVKNSVTIDQSVLNGESEPVLKCPVSEGEAFDRKNLLNQHFAYRGTTIVAGEGYMEVADVGDATLFGHLSLELQEEQRETPLQIKLSKLAGQISRFGYIGACAIICGILLKTYFSTGFPTDPLDLIRLFIDTITVAVTVIVCAVPEGLPMLTSILLSLQALKMSKDNVLVRKINGLETAGSINILFSDKTGTITEGKLSVVNIIDGDLNDITDLSIDTHLLTGIGLNNSSIFSNNTIIGGNATDRALMAHIRSQNACQKIDRSNILETIPFSSTNKQAGVLLKHPIDGFTFYVKGAPEKILDQCSSFMQRSGKAVPLHDLSALNDYIDSQAKKSMRLLAVAAGPAKDCNNLTLLGIISIRDNIRQDAVEAISDVQHAGIQVVMVTGDRKETAQAIAYDAKLLTKTSDVIMTSDELNRLPDDELKTILPNIRVIARALPSDKSRLVRIAQEQDYVVGMTGDGVNDAPALKKADVGFAMGSGTEVAKEAGDIIILDDNFSSICKAILYGRTMFKSIRKFLLFQLTVNVSAVLICFLAPLFGENIVLTVIQLLLINLAMDTLAAIAYGSEPAQKDYMLDKPIPRHESIVTRKMMGSILLSAVYITTLCLCIVFLPQIRELCSNVPYLKSALFATFMMSIIFNGFIVRTSHINPLYRISRNKNFILVMTIIFIMQFAFVTFGGEALSVIPLNACTWAFCGLAAFFIIPLNMIYKLISYRRY